MSVVYIRFPLGPPETSGPPAAARVLARLLARADGAVEVDDWRADAIRYVTQGRSPAPAVGCLAFWAATPEPIARSCGAEAQAFVATALHCVAAMTSVGLPRGGIVRLEPDEAREFAADFNRVFAGAGRRLLADPRGGLACVMERTLLATTRDPEAALGRDIGAFLPSGPDGAKLRGVMSEIEMWLFDHPVNRRRAASQRLPVTGFWLWGGGPVLAEPPSIDAWCAGDDVLLAAWPKEAHWPDREVPRSVRGSVPGAGLVVLAQSPDETAWCDLESDWLEPAEASLRAGHVTGIALCAGRRRYHLSTAASRRFWRRPRPWREYFASHSEDS